MLLAVAAGLALQFAAGLEHAGLIGLLAGLLVAQFVRGGRACGRPPAEG